MPTTYIINRAVDRPIEFRGLKAQYILYAGGILVGDILLFAILYICRVNSWVCVGVSFGLGGGGITMLYKSCKKYGEHGLAKKRAAGKVPPSIRCHSRSLFTDLNK
ncbi:DUF4133 domain-containing protein [Flavitalea sp. BT771]|uniref:DUF4133 domain-containing protein n=1 Tax=Flavitalea sp. BT771 TaxID=3063329 RepID=UPI0026E1DA1B|nr:DUF4133 domain-containing protein [Flavitalea sp. BT771]MDO6433286.1 DUF4133 domain-containing protein [Flavitalea sp. BT771]MDV6222809.1 DUF4133 domain-containing protein [Flavitalea sp. BT771]